ncbi:MAG TPA: hypothetical protein VLV54_10905, partial [Thermoanaerobaculia bacterium]|nr:hypothetical protein [Thermoanaerobaculia bacterium]
MKVTPLGKAIIVLALLVAAFFSVRRFAPDLKRLAPPPRRERLHAPDRRRRRDRLSSPSERARSSPRWW